MAKHYKICKSFNCEDRHGYCLETNWNGYGDSIYECISRKDSFMPYECCHLTEDTLKTLMWKKKLGLC